MLTDPVNSENHKSNCAITNTSAQIAGQHKRMIQKASDEFLRRVKINKDKSLFSIHSQIKLLSGVSFCCFMQINPIFSSVLHDMFT